MRIKDLLKALFQPQLQTIETTYKKLTGADILEMSDKELEALTVSGTEVKKLLLNLFNNYEIIEKVKENK